MIPGLANSATIDGDDSRALTSRRESNAGREEALRHVAIEDLTGDR